MENMKTELTQVEIFGRPVQVRCTPAALSALQKRSQPLWVEMELFFSCLIRKRVLFHEDEMSPAAHEIRPGLRVSFRPVVTKHCNSSDLEGWPPPLEDFPIVNAAPYVPQWLTIDFKGGRWHGEFGYTD